MAIDKLLIPDRVEFTMIPAASVDGVAMFEAVYTERIDPNVPLAVIENTVKLAKAAIARLPNVELIASDDSHTLSFKVTAPRPAIAIMMIGEFSLWVEGDNDKSVKLAGAMFRDIIPDSIAEDVKAYGKYDPAI